MSYTGITRTATLTENIEKPCLNASWATGYPKYRDSDNKILFKYTTALTATGTCHIGTDAGVACNPGTEVAKNAPSACGSHAVQVKASTTAAGTQNATLDGSVTKPCLDAGWVSGYPNYNSATDEIEFRTTSNRSGATATCSIVGQSGSVGCNPGSATATLPAPSACGSHSVRAAMSVGAESETLAGSVTKPCPDSSVPPGDSGESQRGAITSPSAPVLPTQDHSQLPAGAEVMSDSPWIGFREVSGAAISNPEVREAALSAIDVTAPMGADAEVCFAGVGAMLLLDTMYSPRMQLPLASYARADGKTCARIDRAGTVVLLPGTPSGSLETPTATLPEPTATAAPTRDPNLIADSQDTAEGLSGCTVWSTAILNFRASPAGAVLRWFNGNANAIARTDNWFQVVDRGEVGWISANYVTTSGDCG